MLKPQNFRIAEIHVPAKRRGSANPDVVREIAESMLEIGQQAPILFAAMGTGSSWSRAYIDWKRA